MDLFLGLDQLKRRLKNPVLTLGNFDGVHLGHQQIFQRVKEEARRAGGEATVVTFEPHPLKVLAPHRCPTLLTSFQRKVMLIEKAGIDTVICLNFSHAFSQISPFDFVKKTLIDQIGAKKIIVGYNYHFGKAQEGDVQTLERICRGFHVEVEAVDALLMDDTVVSSSKIRELVKSGRVDEASALLGRHYSIVGTVVEGKKRGQTLGFPTANIESSDELFPTKGVYAVEALWHARRFMGVANIGTNPTFRTEAKGGRETLTIEVHLLDFTGNLYGAEIQIEFRRRIRDEITFSSVSELIVQIQEDIRWARQNVFEK